MPELTPRKRRALAKAKRLAVTIPDMQGVDFGYVYRDGRLTKTMGIRFHVERKKLPGELRTGEFAPHQIDGILCDVVQASYMPHASISPRTLVEPMQPGISIGNLKRRTAGTLGTFVKERASNVSAILSNWHVLVANAEATVGETIIQPAGRFLGPNPAREVAKLERWLDLDNGYDVAMAKLVDHITINPQVANWEHALVGVMEPRLGMRVVKSSSMSIVTNALVDGVEGSYLIDYTNYGMGKRWMKGIRLVPDPDAPLAEISLGGDSGAIWFESVSRNAIALHFAGEDALTPLYEYALAHPLIPILDMLDIDIVSANA